MSDLDVELLKYRKLGDARYYQSLKARYPGLSKSNLGAIVRKLKDLDKSY